MAAAKAPILDALAQVPGRVREALGSILIPDWALWRLGETYESRSPRLAGVPERPGQLDLDPAWAERVMADERGAG